MSSDDTLARVRALHGKARALSDKGHSLRAAENFGLAVEASRALGRDNLVTASLQLLQGHELAGYAVHAVYADVAEHSALAVHRTHLVALMSDAVAALERRRVAGTLLPGACLPAEEAWIAHDVQTAGGVGVPAAEAASLATLVGYDQFLRGAASVLALLITAELYAAECSFVQFQRFAQHVVHAAALMQQPRPYCAAMMGAEVAFVDALQAGVEFSGTFGLDGRLVPLLTGAWEGLQRSGVLEARHIEENLRQLEEAMEPSVRAQQEAVQKSLTAPGLRRCALDGCGAKEAHPTHFKSCAACRAVVYCCREHQVEGWPSHKTACKAARKAAAAAEDEARPSGA